MRLPLPASRRRRRLLIGALATALAGVLLVVGANMLVLLGGSGSATVADAPHAQVALVLGAQVRRDGTMSAMLADRVRVAAELYRAGKVDKVLASGDHGRTDYDEVNAMRRALIAQGVPPRDIFTDHAGFDTWDSAVRARKVFDVSSALVVTQGFTSLAPSGWRAGPGSRRPASRPTSTATAGRSSAARCERCSRA